MVGKWENTQLPGYIEGLLKVSIKKVTEKLGKAAVGVGMCISTEVALHRTLDSTYNLQVPNSHCA